MSAQNPNFKPFSPRSQENHHPHPAPEETAPRGDQHADRLRLPYRPGHGPGANRRHPGRRLAGCGGAGIRKHPAGDHGRYAAPLQGGGARGAFRPAGRRYALPFLPGVRLRSRAQRRALLAGSRDGCGQAGRRAGEAGCHPGHHLSRHPGDGTPGSDPAKRAPARRFPPPGAPGSRLRSVCCKTPRRCKQPAVLPWCSRASRRAWPPWSARAWISRLSASAPAPAAMGRCW